jgi:hypothetical protein
LTVPEGVNGYVVNPAWTAAVAHAQQRGESSMIWVLHLFQAALLEWFQENIEANEIILHSGSRLDQDIG